MTDDKTSVIYTRTSVTPNRVGIDEQRRLCREYAERRGIPLVNEYCDSGISGTKPIPNMQ